MKRVHLTAALGAAALAVAVVPAGAAVGDPTAPGSAAASSSQPAALTGSALAPSTIVQPDAPPIDWGPCEFSSGPLDRPNYQCARYPVPLDYANPDEGTVELALIRRLADDPAARQGSLFLNPGGPGGSGLQLVLNIGDNLFDERVRAEFDLVGFDPRGIASSEPLRCFDGTEDPEDYATPYQWPDSGSDRLDYKKTVDRYARQCDREGGEILDHMSTTDVARDLEQLRKAVGDEQLTFVGLSYGTYIAATYANLFPDRVGAVVADSVLDPIAWSTGRGDEARTVPTAARLGSAAGAQETLEEFFRLCDEAGPAGCALAPDSEQRFDALLAELEERPLVDSFPGGVTNHQDVVVTTLSFLYVSSVWPLLADDLAQLETAVAYRDSFQDPSAARQLSAAFDSTRVPDPYGGLESLSVLCLDTQTPDEFFRWQRAAEDAPGVFAGSWTWLDALCSSWRGEDVDRYEGPFTAQTANPVLVASTRFDPATPYSGAQVLRELLPNSRLLTVEGWGHVTLFLSQCADEVTNTYLLTRELPAEDVTCQQDLGPFGVLPAGATTDAELPTSDEPAALPDTATGPDSLADPDSPQQQATEELAQTLEVEGEPEQAERVRHRADLMELLGSPVAPTAD